MRFLLVGILVSFLSDCNAFVVGQARSDTVNKCLQLRHPTTRTGGWPLRSLASWRTADIPSLKSYPVAPPSRGTNHKHVPLLPFDLSTDLLLVGESRVLNLYEPRFLKLYERASKQYNGIIGCAYITDKSNSSGDDEGGGGICQISSLCEVIKCQKSPALNGQPQSLFLEIRCVSRARIRACVEVLEDKGGGGEGWMVGVVEEVFDNLPPNLELPWVVVDGIEDKVKGIAVAEEKVKISGENRGVRGGDADAGELDGMQKRVAEAQQMEYNMNNGGDDYIKMDNEEEFMEENELIESFEEAKRASAEVASMYGGHEIDEETGKRTTPELVGISWGAFKLPGASYVDRIRALDTDDVFERLKMANYMLMNKQKLLQAKLALSKITAPGDEIQSVDDLPIDDGSVGEQQEGREEE